MQVSLFVHGPKLPGLYVILSDVGYWLERQSTLSVKYIHAHTMWQNTYTYFLQTSTTRQQTVIAYTYKYTRRRERQYTCYAVYIDMLQSTKRSSACLSQSVLQNLWDFALILSASCLCYLNLLRVK